jgi:hypothetical protein
MKPLIRPTSVIVRDIAVTGLASMMLGGCADMSELAGATYAKSAGGGACTPTVRKRADLAGAFERPRYEASGCNGDVIYDSWPRSTDEHGQVTEAACVPNGQCVEPGCDSVELAARNVFARDKTCPLERVSAKPRAAVLPAAPRDIAADPERLRMWTQAHQQEIAAASAQTFMTAAGCGSETAYSCSKRVWDTRDGDGSRLVPVCQALPPP